MRPASLSSAYVLVLILIQIESQYSVSVIDGCFMLPSGAHHHPLCSAALHNCFWIISINKENWLKMDKVSGTQVCVVFKAH